MDNGCDYPLEVCLSFGTGAFYYEENGLGRAIDQEEALEVLAIGQKGWPGASAGQFQKTRQHMHVLRMLLPGPEKLKKPGKPRPCSPYKPFCKGGPGCVHRV